MPGIIEDIIRGTILHNLAGVHHSDVIGHIGHYAQVVSDKDDGQVALFLQTVNQLQNLRLDGHV